MAHLRMPSTSTLGAAMREPCDFPDGLRSDSWGWSCVYDSPPDSLKTEYPCCAVGLSPVDSADSGSALSMCVRWTGSDVSLRTISRVSDKGEFDMQLSYHPEHREMVVSECSPSKQTLADLEAASPYRPSPRRSDNVRQSSREAERCLRSTFYGHYSTEASGLIPDPHNSTTESGTITHRKRSSTSCSDEYERRGCKRRRTTHEITDDSTDTESDTDETETHIVSAPAKYSFCEGEPTRVTDMPEQIYQEPLVNGSINSKPLEIRLILSKRWEQLLASCTDYAKEVSLVTVKAERRHEEPRYFVGKGKGMPASQLGRPTIREMYLDRRKGEPSQLVVMVQRKPKNTSTKIHGWLPTSNSQGGFPFLFRFTLRSSKEIVDSRPVFIDTKQSPNRAREPASCRKSTNVPNRERPTFVPGYKCPHQFFLKNLNKYGSSDEDMFVRGYGFPRRLFQEYRNPDGSSGSEDIVIKLKLSADAMKAMQACRCPKECLHVRLVKDDQEEPVEPEYFDSETRSIKVARPCVTSVTYLDGILTVTIKRKGQGKNNPKSLPLTNCHGGFPFRFCFIIVDTVDTKNKGENCNQDGVVHKHTVVQVIRSQPVKIFSKQANPKKSVGRTGRKRIS
eukprot:gb/GECG01004940.1/.p1 GENE.gb/GECG01004940.1/~~gb/GECG01004940.1/.p1  ORF type:complete len:621 (+),score=52.79 gb/GECG01004940.1/:1-1863(+)